MTNSVPTGNPIPVLEHDLAWKIVHKWPEDHGRVPEYVEDIQLGERDQVFLIDADDHRSLRNLRLLGIKQTKQLLTIAKRNSVREHPDLRVLEYYRTELDMLKLAATEHSYSIDSNFDSYPKYRICDRDELLFTVCLDNAWYVFPRAAILLHSDRGRTCAEIAQRLFNGELYIADVQQGEQWNEEEFHREGAS